MRSEKRRGAPLNLIFMSDNEIRRELKGYCQHEIVKMKTLNNSSSPLMVDTNSKAKC